MYRLETAESWFDSLHDQDIFSCLQNVHTGSDKDAGPTEVTNVLPKKRIQTKDAKSGSKNSPKEPTKALK
jgi:hypothetical protein